MLKCLLKGKALTDFERIKVQENYTELVENVNKMIDKLTEEIFPDLALQKQDRALRRNIQKPENMKTSSFYAWLVEMNEHLAIFQNGKKANKLKEDELKESSYSLHCQSCGKFI